MCSSGCLRAASALLGLLWTGLSVAGLGLALFLLMGDPLDNHAQGTYTPSMEDVVPLFVISMISLLFSAVLLGGSLQRSKTMIFGWLIWFALAPIIFWLWYGYNQLKHYGYIDWTREGMKSCYFCGLQPEESYVTLSGVALTVFDLLCLIIVGQFHTKLKKRVRELGEPQFVYAQNNGGGYQPQYQIPDNVGYSYQFQSLNGYREHNF